jgi:outer membrane lipoprotein-sorting protein
MKSLKLITGFLAFFFFSFLNTHAQDAATLLQNMDKLMTAPKDREATMQMILTDKSGDIKEREALIQQKGTDKKLYRYTKPENQIGTSTLTLPGDVMWLFMPAFDEPTKITLLAKSGSFSGTDFSYEDMSSDTYGDRYDPVLLASQDPATYLLELVPKSKKSKYSKIFLTLNKANFYPVKMEYYDNRDNHFKTSTYKYEKKGSYWYAKEVEMTDLKKEHSTKIIMTDIKFDQGLSDDIFTVENMQEKD